MATMTKEAARLIIEPFYNLFSTARRDWEKGAAVLRDDWVSYYNNDECRNKAASIGFLRKLSEWVPNMEIEIMDVLQDDDKIAVRSRLTGTPAGDFMGVPHSGKSFDIMTIDINQVLDGKLIVLHHLEDWHAALTQLREG